MISPKRKTGGRQFVQSTLRIKYGIWGGVTKDKAIGHCVLSVCFRYQSLYSVMCGLFSGFDSRCWRSTRADLCTVRGGSTGHEVVSTVREWREGCSRAIRGCLCVRVVVAFTYLLSPVGGFELLVVMYGGEWFVLQ